MQSCIVFLRPLASDFLDEGLHAFRLLYFEDYEGQELSWGWKAPGVTEFVPIPAENLFVK